MVQDQEWRKDAGCQWESPKGEKREEKRDVGCQSEPAESRDAAVQVDFRSTGVCDVPWQCTSVRLDEPGGVNTRPPFYPVYPPYTTPLLTMMPQFRSASPDLPHLHLARSLPSMPLYQPPLFLAQGTIPLPRYFPLPSVPMWNMPPSAGGRCDPSPPQTPMDSSVPPGLIAPLSPRLAEEEDEEEGFFLKDKKVLHGTKRSTVTPQKKKKKNMSQCRAKSRPAVNKRTKPKVYNTVSRRRGEVCSITHRKRRSEEKWQLHQLQDVLHPEERSFVTDTQQSYIQIGEPEAQIQLISAEGGSEKGLKKKKNKRLLEQNEEQENGSMMMMEEGGRGAKCEKIKMEGTKQVVRPRRNAVGPPIRYLIQSEVRSCGLSVDNQGRKKVKRKNGGLWEDQQEEEIEGAGVTEAKESSRVGSTEGSGIEGWWQPCQVCGLKFNKEASLQLHLSVHRTGRWFNCHLCSKRFRLAHTLCQHHRQNHRGNRGSHSKIGGRVGATGLTTSDNREVKFNTSSDRERTERQERSEEGEETEEKLLLPPPTKAPDWLTRINRVRRNPRWWVDFQSLTKRRQENIEWWRMLQENDGGRGRKGKQSRKKEVNVKQVCEKEEKGDEEERSRDREEMVEVKAVSLMKEGGVEVMKMKAVCATRKDSGEEGERRKDGGENKEEVKLVCVMDEGGGVEEERRVGGENNEEVKVVSLMEEDGGEEGGNRGHGGEENQGMRQVELKKEVMEHAQRPRRMMVGPPIRYLLESEEQSHCPVTANQERLKLKKKTQKSEAEGRASGRMAVTDRTENRERRPGPTNQDKANNPKWKRGGPKKVVIFNQGGGGVSEIQTGHLVSETQIDHLVSDTKTDYLVSDGQAGHIISDRQKGLLGSERQMGDMGLDKQVNYLVSERMLEKQTCQLMSGEQTGHLVSDGQIGSLVSERQTGHMVSERQTDHLVSERQTGHLMSGRQMGHLASDGQIINMFLDTQTEIQTSHFFCDRQAGPLVSDRQTSHLFSDGQTGYTDSYEQTDPLVSERQKGHMFSERQTDHLVSERQTGYILSDRQSCPLASERQMGDMGLDKQMDHMVSERTLERQTCQLIPGGQKGHLALDRQIINMFLDTQTETQASDTFRKKQTNRQTETYRQTYLVYRDLQSGQVTLILPCSVRLERLL
ncbi:Zinc finger and BTB domain-containing protein 37 [Channa argus]|uniref:Zinc finger and BTB domain-containing protein 37 n=1 Tax=Channa argus TaxID=215402 RepID=A0A6G1QPD1_CHAAH|nr:Zinc finger and BTB domain-containing protein 37 [Channa argus]KAK2886840.1 hypothetical protein Q8A73_020786 [Channa argus]